MGVVLQIVYSNVLIITLLIEEMDVPFHAHWTNDMQVAIVVPFNFRLVVLRHGTHVPYCLSNLMLTNIDVVFS